MSYKAGIFTTRNPDRQAQRKSKFDEFFADVGLKPEPDTFKHDPNPDIQLGKVKDLIDKAKGLHQDDTAAINMLKAEVAMLGLGVSLFSVIPTGRPDINLNSTTEMALSFFTTDFG